MSLRVTQLIMVILTMALTGGLLFHALGTSRPTLYWVIAGGLAAGLLVWVIVGGIAKVAEWSPLGEASARAFFWACLELSVGRVVRIAAIKEAVETFEAARDQRRRIAELRKEMAIWGPTGAKADIFMQGAWPARWGEWTPAVLPLFPNATNFSRVCVKIAVPSVSQQEKGKAYGLEGAKPEVDPDRYVGVRVIAPGAGTFINCVVYGDGHFVVNQPIRQCEEDYRPETGERGQLPADQWHIVQIDKADDRCAVMIDGLLVSRELMPWPDRANIELVVTSPHVQPKGWFVVEEVS